ncbi:MAG: potassium channel family protein [Acetatifactor sp.]|nr:potassium channel family protein [Acetatifactor sp.]
MGNVKQYEIIEQNDKAVSIKVFNQIREFKVVTNNDIKSMVDKGEDIVLENCYIKDFCYWKVCGYNSSREAEEDNYNKKKPLNNFCARKAFFGGDVDFTYAQFGNGYVDFSNAQFWDGNVYFTQAQFGVNNVDFIGAQFGGAVYFTQAQFSNSNVDFTLTKFGGFVDFIGAEFGDNDVFFFGAEFGDSDVFFFGAQFGDGKVDFSNVQFGNGDVIFSGVSFGRSLILLDNVVIKGRLFLEPASCIETNLCILSCYFLSHASIDITHIKHLFFDGCTNSSVLSINASADYSDEQKSIALFNHSNVGTLNINWGRIKDAVKRFDFSFLNDIKDKPFVLERFSELDNLDELKADEYVMLKENFHNQGRYDWEDEAYVEFKRIDTNLLKFQKGVSGIGKKAKNRIKYPILKILERIGKYGTDPFSVFLTMILSVIFFGGLYSWLPCAEISASIDKIHWWSGLYYSAITFFTIGYGDLSAQNGLTAVLCALEGFLGVFLMSYFSVALVRKILR